MSHFFKRRSVWPVVVFRSNKTTCLLAGGSPIQRGSAAAPNSNHRHRLKSAMWSRAGVRFHQSKKYGARHPRATKTVGNAKRFISRLLSLLCHLPTERQTTDLVS